MSVWVIEGSIAVGKTTLGESLLKRFGERCVFMSEEVPEVLLSLYLKDMQRYAFAFQTIMANRRYQKVEEAKRLAAQGKIVVIDRGLVGDMAFATMQMRKNYFTDEEFSAYLDLVKRPPQPNDNMVKTFFLECTPETAMTRLHQRGHEGENKAYTISYLRDLINCYRELLPADTIFIDWNNEVNTVEHFLNHVPS